MQPNPNAVLVTPEMVLRVLDRRATLASPEQTILWAIVRRAVQDYASSRYPGDCRRFFAGKWFEAICSYCEVSPAEVVELTHQIGTFRDIQAPKGIRIKIFTRAQVEARQEKADAKRRAKRQAQLERLADMRKIQAERRDDRRELEIKLKFDVSKLEAAL